MKRTCNKKSKAHGMRGVAFMLVFCMLFCPLCLSACARAEKAAHVSFFAMDTVMDLSVYGDKAVLVRAEALVRSLESKLSVTSPSSELYLLNERGTAELSHDTYTLISAALSLGELTHGALDITIYPVVRAWGFTTGEYRVPGESELAELVKNVDYTRVRQDGNTVSLPEGFMLDLGAVAKGRTADLLTSLFAENGISSAIINLGGNVQAIGTKPDGSPWSVALADPFGGEYAGVLNVSSSAVVTSGGYQRYFEQDGVTYRHIIDPKTGRPVDNGLASVSIICKTGLMADALSTALYVMGLEEAIEFWRANPGFEAVFITEDRELFITEGLESVFSPRGEYEKPGAQVIKRQPSDPSQL